MSPRPNPSREPVSQAVKSGAWAGPRSTDRSRSSPNRASDRALALSPQGHSGKIAYRMAALLTPAEAGGWRWKQDRRRPNDYPAILAAVGRLDQIAPAAAGC